MEENIPPLMEEALYRAAIEGDTAIFDEKNIAKHGNSYFTDQTTPERNNIIHIAAEYNQYKFIETGLTIFPDLITRRNSNKDTPLHVAAKKGHHKTVELLVSRRSSDAMEAGEEWLWEAKNSQGDTALHCALSNNKVNVGMELLKVVSYKGLSFVNEKKETPFHVFLRYCSANALLKEGVLKLQSLCKAEDDEHATAHTSIQHDPQSFIKEILEEFLKYKPATCIRDQKGLTPLLIAAEQGFLQAVKLIVTYCPQSAEICDSEGRTVLHYLNNLSNRTDITGDAVDGNSSSVFKDLKELLNIPEINAMKNRRDFHGNTPVLAALEAKRFVLVRALAGCSADFTINNENGVCALDIIKSLPDLPIQMKEIKDLVLVAQKKLKAATLGIKMMEANVYKAAVNGEWHWFDSSVTVEAIDIVPSSSEDSCKRESTSDNVQMIGIGNNDSKFLSHTPDGSNILHIAFQQNQRLFVEEAIKRFPELIFEVDCNGDTPLHIAAKYYENGFSKLIGYIKDHCLKVEQEKSREPFVRPWVAKNSKGNTPLHEALQGSSRRWQFWEKRQVVEELVNLGPEVLEFVNDDGETPLHIFARHRHPSFDAEKYVTLLHSDDKPTVYMKDNEGLAPLLRAAKSSRIYAAEAILKLCPQSIQLRDNRGRSFLHLLNLTLYENNNNTSDEYAFSWMARPFFEIPEVDFLRNVQDFDGNTPLHLAIKEDDSLKIKFLARRIMEAGDKEFDKALDFRDNEGQCVIDLLATHEDAPNEILQLFNKKSSSLKVSWIRSSYGICKSQIKETTNTLSVVAALLATLTFAAAFQVPGGFDNDGTPNLLKDPAFQVFMVSNTCAMCGSMTVLFALLWVITTGKRTDSLILLDLSITLLLLSFYATLVAFMTGVYAVISPHHHQALWLAIFVIVLSSTVIVFTRKNIVLRVTRFIELLFHYVYYDLYYWCKRKGRWRLFKRS